MGDKSKGSDRREAEREREIIGRGQYRTAKRQVKKKKKLVEEMKKLKKSDRR